MCNEQFKLSTAVQLSAMAVMRDAFDSTMRSLCTAYDIDTADITPVQSDMLDALLIGMAKLAAELVEQNADLAKLEQLDWYTGIDWRYAQKLAVANVHLNPVACSFEYRGVIIINPFINEYNDVPVNPVKYYGEAFLNSDFCRRPSRHILGGE